MISNKPQTRESASAPCNEELAPGAQAAEHEALGDSCRLELVEDAPDIVDPPGLVRAFVGPQLWILATGFTDPGQV